MTSDDLIYLIGLKQIQLEILQKEITQLKADKQASQDSQKKTEERS